MDGEVRRFSRKPGGHSNSGWVRGECGLDLFGLEIDPRRWGLERG